jgi:hypothetical protein
VFACWSSLAQIDFYDFMGLSATLERTLKNIRLEIASQLLSSLICQDRGQSLEARMVEVDHCLNLADLLIARSTHGTPALTHAMRPTKTTKALPHKEENNSYSAGSFQQRLIDRRSRELPSIRPGKRPALH